MTVETNAALVIIGMVVSATLFVANPIIAARWFAKMTNERLDNVTASLDRIADAVERLQIAHGRHDERLAAVERDVQRLQPRIQ